MSAPTGLQDRGRSLWAALEEARDLTGGNWHLAEEACRIADRLDGLDRILTAENKTWAHFRSLPNGDGATYKLIITGALMEARQQAIVLRQIVAGLPLKGDDGDDVDLSGFGIPT